MFKSEFKRTIDPGPRRVVSQPSRSTGHAKASDDDALDDVSDSSDDPILLTENSSLPGSPVRPKKQNQRARDDDPKDTRRATSSKTMPQEPKESLPKKRGRAPVNPYSTGLTRTSAKAPPAKAKAAAPSTAGTADVDNTPKPTRKPEKKLGRAVSLQIQKSQDFPMKSRHKDSSPPPASLKQVPRRDAPSTKAKPFPLEHLALEKRVTRNKPAPFPLAAELKARDAATAEALETPRPSRLQKSVSAAAVTRPHTPALLRGQDPKGSSAKPTPKAQRSLEVLMSRSTPRNSGINIADMSTDTPSPARPELLRKTVAPFPLPPPDRSLRPFPMTIHPSTNTSPKRPNEDAVDSDRSSKRRKCDSDDDDVSSPEPAKPMVDPSLLCPFCDEILPKNSSSLFKELLTAALAKSWNAPRRANPKGKRAPLLAYISVCERHRFEAKILPQAVAAGWPTEIDFNNLPHRVQRRSVKQVLDSVLEHPETSSFFMEAAENIVRVGARVAESAMGQFAIFENIQPGYYGERGSIVLHQTLFALFPPQVLAKAQLAPLSAQTFLHAVLVPEAALALIMEDSKTPRADALKIMRASGRYGALMFPDDDEADGNGAGEAMMRERARQRRKELEQEEADDKRLAFEAKSDLQPMEIVSDASQTSSRKRTTRPSNNDAAPATRRRKTKLESEASGTDSGLVSSSTSKRERKKPTKRGTTGKNDDDNNLSTNAASTRPIRATRKNPSYVEIDSDGDSASRAKPALKVASRKPAGEIVDLTSSDNESVSNNAFPRRRGSRRAPASFSSISSASSKKSASTTVSRVLVDRPDDSDDEIPSEVLSALQHHSESSQDSDWATSRRMRSGPLRDMDNVQELSQSRRNGRSTSFIGGGDNTPKCQHLRKDENEHERSAADDNTPRVSAGLHRASYVSPERRSKSVSSKLQSYRRSREDDFLFSSPSQRGRSLSQHSVSVDE